jgi:hypothetical protein
MFAAVDGGAICNRCQLFVLTNSSVVQENILIEIKHELKVISKRTRKIEYRLTYEDLNPWLDMATSRGSHVDDLRRKIEAKSNGLKCWLSDCDRSTKVAHILPDSCSHRILDKLKLPHPFKNDVNANPWNFMVLDTVLESAFDRLMISFTPKDIFHPTVFVLKIWDRSCVETLLGSGCKIGDYEGKELNIPENVIVSRRALSYQALMAYLHTKQRNHEEIDVPVDFSSEFSDKNAFRNELTSVLATSIREESTDEEDDERPMAKLPCIESVGGST